MEQQSIIAAVEMAESLIEHIENAHPESEPEVERYLRRAAPTPF